SLWLRIGKSSRRGIEDDEEATPRDKYRKFLFCCGSWERIIIDIFPIQPSSRNINHDKIDVNQHREPLLVGENA
ncbi:MAG: hypothetical protein OEW23_17810, partial [Candidatus Aminicenantes bacterium]|nr:hypothetical protein [Candidatus Aminicenantes bacterium]